MVPLDAVFVLPGCGQSVLARVEHTRRRLHGLGRWSGRLRTRGWTITDYGPDVKSAFFGPFSPGPLPGVLVASLTVLRPDVGADARRHPTSSGRRPYRVMVELVALCPKRKSRIGRRRAARVPSVADRSPINVKAQQASQTENGRCQGERAVAQFHLGGSVVSAAHRAKETQASGGLLGNRSTGPERPGIRWATGHDPGDSVSVWPERQ